VERSRHEHEAGTDGTVSELEENRELRRVRSEQRDEVVEAGGAREIVSAPHDGGERLVHFAVPQDVDEGAAVRLEVRVAKRRHRCELPGASRPDEPVVRGWTAFVAPTDMAPVADDGDVEAGLDPPPEFVVIGRGLVRDFDVDAVCRPDRVNEFETPWFMVY